MYGNLLGGHRRPNSSRRAKAHFAWSRFVLNFVLKIASSGGGKSPAGVGVKRGKFHSRAHAVDGKVQNRVSTHLYVCWSAYQTSTLRPQSET